MGRRWGALHARPAPQYRVPSVQGCSPPPHIRPSAAQRSAAASPTPPEAHKPHARPHPQPHSTPTHLVVRGKHAHVERHGAHHGGAGAGEEAAHSLLLDNARQRIPHTLHHSTARSRVRCDVQGTVAANCNSGLPRLTAPVAADPSTVPNPHPCPNSATPHRTAPPHTTTTPSACASAPPTSRPLGHSLCSCGAPQAAGWCRPACG